MRGKKANALRIVIAMLDAHSDIKWYAYSMEDEERADRELTLLNNIDKGWQFSGYLMGNKKDNTPVLCSPEFAAKLKTVNSNVISIK